MFLISLAVMGPLLMGVVGGGSVAVVRAERRALVTLAHAQAQVGTGTRAGWLLHRHRLAQAQTRSFPPPWTCFCLHLFFLLLAAFLSFFFFLSLSLLSFVP